MIGGLFLKHRAAFDKYSGRIQRKPGLPSSNERIQI